MEPNHLELPNIHCYSEGTTDDKLKGEVLKKKHILESLGPENLVMIILPNSHDFVTWIVSIYQLGMPCALVSPLWKISTTTHMIGELDPEVIVTSPSKVDIYLNLGYKLIESTKHHVILKREAVSEPKTSIEKNRTILFSSGSTGTPKAIIHKNTSLVQNAIMHAESIQMNKDEVVLGVLPFYYSYGFVSILLSSCLIGCSMVINGPILHPRQLYKAIKSNNITLLPLTPYLVKSALFTQPDHFPPTLMKMTIGGDEISDRFLTLLAKYYSNEIFITFGLTEAGPRVLTGKVDSNLQYELKPLEGVSVRVNPDAEEGVLEVKTPTMMEGYLEKGTINLNLIEGSFFSTEDLFLKVNDGWRFVARQRDIIVRAGEKINPSKIKDVLQSHPMVQEASISKKLDHLEEEIPCAKVVLRETVVVDELLKWCKNYLTTIELPQEILIVEEIKSK